MHPKLITLKCERGSAMHSVRKQTRSQMPSLWCKVCRLKDPNFWKKSMHSAVSHLVSFMRRSLYVGQSQLCSCVQRVKNCSETIPSDQPCFLTIESGMDLLIAHATACKHVLRARIARIRHRRCAHKQAFAPTSKSPHAHEHARTNTCMSTRMPSRPQPSTRTNMRMDICTGTGSHSSRTERNCAPHSTPHTQFRSSREEANTQTSIAPAQPDSPAPLSSFSRDTQHSCIQSMDANSNQSRSSRHILCCFSQKETSRKSLTSSCLLLLFFWGCSARPRQPWWRASAQKIQLS